MHCGFAQRQRYSVGDVDHHAMGTWIETSLAIAEECGLAPVTAKCEELMNSSRGTPQSQDDATLG